MLDTEPELKRLVSVWGMIPACNFVIGLKQPSKIIKTINQIYSIFSKFPSGTAFFNEPREYFLAFSSQEIVMIPLDEISKPSFQLQRINSKFLRIPLAEITKFEVSQGRSLYGESIILRLKTDKGDEQFLIPLDNPLRRDYITVNIKHLLKIKFFGKAVINQDLKI